MDALDACNGVEQLGHQGEALLTGCLGEVGVVVLPLLELIVLGRPQVGEQVGIQVHRIGTVRPDGLAGQVRQLPVKLLGVGQLLVCGEQKDLLDHVQVFLSGHTGGDGIAVPGLALPREGPHQVDVGLTAGEGLCFVWHEITSFSELVPVQYARGGNSLFQYQEEPPCPTWHLPHHLSGDVWRDIPPLRPGPAPFSLAFSLFSRYNNENTHGC